MMKYKLLLVSLFSTMTLTAHGAEKLGIPACDELIKNFQTCVDTKVPAEQRADAQASIDEMHKSLLDAKTQMKDDAAMAQVCVQATEHVKSMLDPMGCKF